jgi:hypothetical protein
MTLSSKSTIHLRQVPMDVDVPQPLVDCGECLSGCRNVCMLRPIDRFHHYVKDEVQPPCAPTTFPSQS